MKKEALSRFYSTYRLFIFPAVIILSCLILIAFIIFPQASKLISNSKLEADLKSRHKILEAKAEVLESIDEQDLSSKVNTALSAYPSERDFASVVGLLQNLTQLSGFTISSLSLSQSTGSKYGNSQSYSVKLEVLGPESLFPNFISSIESSPRIMRLSSMDISSTRSTGILNLVLAIEVLYASLPATFGTVDSPLPKLTSKDEELIVKLAGISAISSPETVTLSPRGKSNPFE